MPAMQIYLIETKHSTRPLQRHVSSQKLHLFMMVLAEMRDNYWGADAVLRLFQAAEAALSGTNEAHHDEVITQMTPEDAGEDRSSPGMSSVARSQIHGSTEVVDSNTQNTGAPMPSTAFPLDVATCDLLDWPSLEFLADVQGFDFPIPGSGSRLDAWSEF